MNDYLKANIKAILNSLLAQKDYGITEALEDIAHYVDKAAVDEQEVNSLFLVEMQNAGFSQAERAAAAACLVGARLKVAAQCLNDPALFLQPSA